MVLWKSVDSWSLKMICSFFHFFILSFMNLFQSLFEITLFNIIFKFTVKHVGIGLNNISKRVPNGNHLGPLTSKLF